MGPAAARRYRRAIAYEPLASQHRFHRLATRFRGFSGPVGSGKTQALCHEALRLGYLNRGCLGLIGAPTYRMLEDVTKRMFLEILEANAVPHKLRKSENALELTEPEARVLFRSMDEPTRLIGTNLAWFACDELTYTKPDAWRRLIARLRAPQARQVGAIAAWTPKGFDWVYERFIGAERKAGYEAILATPRENVYLRGDYYDELRDSYDERFYRQEVLGEYLNVFSGQAYWNFDRTAHVKPLEFDARFPLAWSLDFNVDPMCSVIAQVIDTTTPAEARVGKTSKAFHVLDEMALPDTRTPQAVEQFLRKAEGYRTQGLKRVHVYGDATGRSRQSAAFQTDWQIVKDMLRAAQWLTPVFRVGDSNPPVRDRVTAVCSALRSQSGEARLHIDPRCRELIRDVEQVAWKRTPSGLPVDDLDGSDPARTHTSDALGYLIWRERCGAAGPRGTVIV